MKFITVVHAVFLILHSFSSWMNGITMVAISSPDHITHENLEITLVAVNMKTTKCMTTKCTNPHENGLHILEIIIIIFWSDIWHSSLKAGVHTAFPYMWSSWNSSSYCSPLHVFQMYHLFVFCQEQVIYSTVASKSNTIFFSEWSHIVSWKQKFPRKLKWKHQINSLTAENGKVNGSSNPFTR